MAGLGGAWGSREEFLHPRDRHGRFRTKWKMAEGVADAISNFLDRFNPRTFQSDNQSSQYLFNRAKPSRFGGGQGYPRLHADFDETNTHLRSGEIDEPTKKFVKMMDDSSVTTTEDLIFSRTMGADSFGLTPETLGQDEGGIEDFTARLMGDRGYTAAVIGTPMGHGPGKVTMSVAVPKGTKVIIPARSQTDRGVFFDKDQEFRITKVTSDGRGGFYMMAIATPRTPGETPEPIDRGPRGVGLTPQQREAGVLGLQQAQAKGMKQGEQPPGPATSPVTPHQNAPTGPVDTGPGGPPPRNEPIHAPSIGAGTPPPSEVVPGQTPTPQAPTPETPQAPVPDIRRAVREAGIPSPSEGDRRRQWNNAFLGVASGKKNPEDMLRELETDISRNRHLQEDDKTTGRADPHLADDIKSQDQLADAIAKEFGLQRQVEQAPVKKAAPSKVTPIAQAPGEKHRGIPGEAGTRPVTNLEARRAAKAAQAPRAPQQEEPTPPPVKKAAPEVAKVIPIKQATGRMTLKEAQQRTAIDALHENKIEGEGDNSYKNILRNVESGDWSPARARQEAKGSAKYFRKSAEDAKGFGRATPEQRQQIQDKNNAIADKYDKLADELLVSGSVTKTDKYRNAPQVAKKAAPSAPAAKKAAPAAPQPPGDVLKKLQDFDNPPSREEAHALLQDMSKVELLGVAKEISLPGASSMNKEQLRREIVEGTAGRRLDSIAIRGFRGTRPEAPGAELTREQKLAGEVAGAPEVPPGNRIPVRGGGFMDTRTGELHGGPNAPAPEAAAAPDIDKMTKAELLAHARRPEISANIRTSMTKDQLKQAIRQAEEIGPPTPGSRVGKENQFKEAGLGGTVKELQIIADHEGVPRRGRPTNKAKLQEAILANRAERATSGVAGTRRINTHGGAESTGLTTEQYNALSRYMGGAFGPTNRSLRGRARQGDTAADAAVVDELMATSPMTEDKKVFRGLRTGNGIFGPRDQRPKDLTGFEWTDEGFVSTALNEGSAADFAKGPIGGEGGVLLRMNVPKGTNALDLRGGALNEDELLLQRGLRMRVTGEGGTRRLPDGSTARILDVEVVPSGRAAEPNAASPHLIEDLADGIGIRGDAGGLIPARQLDLNQGMSELEVADRIFRDADELEASPMPAPGSDRAVTKDMQNRRDENVAHLRDLAARLRAHGSPPTEPNAPAAQRAIQAPDRREAFAEDWINTPALVHINEKTAAGRSINEVRDDILKGKITPDEGIRRLENDIDLNKQDLTEVEQQLREDVTPQDRSRLMDARDKLRQGISDQEIASSFMRKHFRKAPAVTPKEVEVQLDPEAAKVVQGASPDEIREAAKIAGFGELKGESKDELLQDLVKKIAGKELASRAAKKAAPKKLAPAPLVTKKSGDPDYVDAKAIAEGLDMDESDSKMLSYVQELLDGTDTKRPMTPAAVGRELTKFANGPAGPAYRSATLVGVNHDGLNPEQEKEHTRLQAQFKRWTTLADRLQKTRRRPARKATEPAPEKPKLTTEEKKVTAQAAEVLGVPKEQLQSRALAKKVAAAPPAEAAKSAVETMRTMQSREEGETFLKNRTKAELTEIAKASGVPVASKDTEATLTQKIVRDNIGARLEMGVLTRGTPLSERQGTVTHLEDMPLAQLADLESQLGIKRTSLDRGDRIAAIKAAQAEKSAQASIPKSLPSSGRKWNWETIQEDGGTMHGDSASMNLAQKLRKAGREDAAQYVADMRFHISNNFGEHDAADVEKMVADLKKMRDAEPDPNLKRAYDRALEDIDAPQSAAPKIPESTPDSLKKIMSELNQIPVARKTGHFAGTVKEVSAVDRLAEFIRKVEAGDVDRIGSVESEIRRILRSFHESVDGAYQMWRLEKLINGKEVLAWALSNRPKT